MKCEPCPAPFAALGAFAVLLGSAFAQSPQANTTPAEAVSLSAFVVDATTTRGYAASNTLSGTRTNLPLIEIPVSVQVITGELIQDMMALNDYEATRYNASWDERRVRGYRANFNLRNGFRRADLMTPWIIDRADLIMGPAAVLYGISQPGGIMNITTKPALLGRNTREIRQVFGSFGYNQTVVDVNQSLTPDLSLRFIGGHMNYYGTDGETAQGDLWVDHNEQRTLSGMLAGTWRLAPNTLLTFDVEIANRDEKEARSAYQMLDGTVPIAVGWGIPIEYAFTGPDVDTYDNIRSLQGKISHRVSRQLEFQFAIDYFSRMNNRANSSRVPGVDTNPATNLRSARVLWQSFSFDLTYLSGLASAVYSFDIGETKHKVFASFQYNDEQSKGIAYEDQIGSTGQRRFRWFSLADWRNADLRRPGDINYVRLPRSRNDNNYYTGSVSYQGKFLKERLILSPGITYTNIDNTLIPDVGARQEFPQDKYNPQIGALFRVTPSVSLFALHATSVWPRTGVDQFGNPWKTESGESVELGVKVNLFRNFAVGSVSGYKIVQQNQVVFDPLAPNPIFNQTGNPADRGGQLQVGENTAEGIDVELVLSPSDHWQVIFTYAYNDLYRTSDPVPANNGLRSSQWMRNSATAWTKYTFADGPLKGLYVGGGARFNGKRFRGYRSGQETYEDPHTFADAVVGWSHRWNDIDWTLTLNGRNLLKTSRVSGYVPGTIEGYSFEMPREYYLSLSARF